jgi:inner membrane protein involved in colicin E2 resistance
MQPLGAYLQFVSPETLVLLNNENVSFRYRGKYEFRVIGTRHIFDQAFELATHRQDKGRHEQQSVGCQNILRGFKDRH